MEQINVVPSDDIGAAAWIGPRLRPFTSYQAGSVVPGGFDAYARIDHERGGVLREARTSALVGRLKRHTSTPDFCWMALWDGYGYVDVGSRGVSWQVLTAAQPGAAVPSEPVDYAWPIPPQRPRAAPRLRLPNRDYVLYRGTLGQVPGWMDGPNLWWPDDRAWCVASEIDLPWTYVGGSKTLIADVLSDPELSAQPLSLDESTLAKDHPELGERP